LDQPPLSELTNTHADVLSEVVRIMEKKAANRTVMPEEYTTLGKFAALSESRLLAQREQRRQARLAEIKAVKATLPQGAFLLPIDSLDLPDEILEVLQPLENVGEIMWRFLIDENSLHRLLDHLP